METELGHFSTAESMLLRLKVLPSLLGWLSKQWPYICTVLAHILNLGVTTHNGRQRWDCMAAKGVAELIPHKDGT